MNIKKESQANQIRPLISLKPSKVILIETVTMENATSETKKDVNFKAGRIRPQPAQKALDVPLFIVLGLFVLVLAAMIAGLEVLKHFSDAQQGLAFVTQDQHFLWTYGPTFGKCQRYRHI